MKIRNIDFVQEDVGAVPSKVVVEMTIEEAVWIAEVAGSTCNSETAESIYRALAGDVFNRYWDDGVDAAFRDFGPVVPPIRYDENAKADRS